MDQMFSNISTLIISKLFLEDVVFINLSLFVLRKNSNNYKIISYFRSKLEGGADPGCEI